MAVTMNNDTSGPPSVLDRVMNTITGPRTSWRSLGGSAKLALYLRWSLLTFIVAMGVAGAVVTGASATYAVPTPAVVAFAVLIFTATLLTGAVIELQPDLNAHPRRDIKGLFMTGAVFTLLLWVAALVLYRYALVVESAGEEQAVWLLGYAVASLVLTVGLLHMGYIPWVRRKWLVSFAVLGITGAVMLIGTDAENASDLIVIVIFAISFMVTTVLTQWTVRVVKELDRARHTEAALQVSEERLRFAQQLHDTMGQHLAAMSVKTELATALARRGDDRLFDELEQLRQLTKVSAADMRSVVDNHRSINLSTEVGSARSLFDSAGIDVNIFGEALDLPEPRRELAAWFVRETTTNALRHADATTAELHISEDSVMMVNDGAPPEDSTRSGGLGSLRGRASRDGATVTINRDDDRFSVRLSWPGTTTNERGGLQQ